MNRKARILILLIFINLLTSLRASSQPLTVGDRVPDLVIKKIINLEGSTKQRKISNWKDKLLILDFWSTGCSGCIEALPKMQELINRFGQNLQILAVTNENEGLIKKFWNSNKFTRGLSIPSVVEDEVLNKYFKHMTIPHEVWIYKSKVIGITNSQYVDENNIQKILNGEVIDWPIKYDFYKINASKPLLIADSADKNYYSIRNYIEGITSEGFTGYPIIYRNSGTIRCNYLNESIFNAYTHYINKTINLDTLIKPYRILTSNQIEWLVSDKTNYKYEYDVKNYGYREDWLRRRGICFESLTLDSNQTDIEIAKDCISHLNELLGLNVEWRRRVERIYVVKKANSQPLNPQPKGKKYIMAGLIYQLNQQATNPYIFDEVKNSDEVEIVMNLESFTDLNSLKTQLEHNGYVFQQQERAVDKITIVEIKKGFFGNWPKQINKFY